MGKQFKIKLESTPNDIHLGVVKGEVIVEVVKDKKYKKIKVEVCGVAKTEWKEELPPPPPREGEERQDPRIIEYSAKRKFAKKSAVLWTNDETPDNKLAIGEYSFPFELKLEGDVPSSFKGTHGSIKYEVEATIVKAKPNKDDKDTDKTIHVHEVLDLNSMEHVKHPVIKQDEKTICCLCCASGPISLGVRIPRSGYCCLSDMIPIEVELTNGSSRQINGLSAELIQSVKYTARSEETNLDSWRHEHKVIAKSTGPACEPNGEKSWNCDDLFVPKTDPTIACCEIISVSYHLKVEADIPMALDLDAKIPITLGTVPMNK